MRRENRKPPAGADLQTSEESIRVSTFTRVAYGFAILALLAFLAAAVTLAMQPGTAEGKPQVQPVRFLSDCKTVGAGTYNRWLRVRRQITGNQPRRFASRPVCTHRLRQLLESVRKVRKRCIKHAITSGATWYGGSGDSMTSGTSGAYGDLSSHPWSFAELGMGRAMGGLPPLSWWYVRGPNGKVKRAQKRDIGGGGGPVNGVTRGFDAWHPLAQYLGLMGNGVVQLHRRNCWAK
jgi:hypothetical protein